MATAWRRSGHRWLTNVAAASCTGTGFKYEAGYGCFNLNPAPGTAIERNYGRGPANETLMLRLARTWAFVNKEGGSAAARRPGGRGVVRLHGWRRRWSARRRRSSSAAAAVAVAVAR